MSAFSSSVPVVATVQDLPTPALLILGQFPAIARQPNDGATESIRESWCADFISWTYLQADTQLVNPHSGYWRIPGVLTLQTYFRDNGAYTSVDSGYIPKLGDVAFYIGSQTPDNTSDEHAAFVIAANGDQITTLGGNEGTGVMRLRTEKIQQNKDKGLVGYGQLEL